MQSKFSYDFSNFINSSPAAQAALEENNMRALHCIVCFYFASEDLYVTYEITDERVPNSKLVLEIDQRKNKSGI
jgi:hypothetical protein